MNQLVMQRTTRRAAAAGRGPRVPAEVPAGGRRRAPVGPPVQVPGRVPTHDRRTVVAVALGVVLVLLGATWSLAEGWGRGPVAGPGELAVDGGLVRVDGVVSAAAPQHAMPGMGTDEDPVAEGMRRISVDVTLMAGAEPLEYAGERFRLMVDGEAAARLTHRDILPGEVLPAGTQMAGTILFDVPADATTATLTYDGEGSTDVVVPPELEQAAGTAPAGDPTTDAGHGAAGHTGAGTDVGSTTGADE